MLMHQPTDDERIIWHGGNSTQLHYERLKNDDDLWVEDEFDDYFDPGSESFHPSTGLGLKIGYNENQIISVDYGFALDERDGKSGLYIRFYWLF